MKPRILALCQSLPYPPHSGVTNRTFHLLTELEKEFAVTLIPFFRVNHQPTTEERRSAHRELAARLTAVAEPVPIGGESSLPRRLLDHTRSLLTGTPYTYFEYGSAQFTEALASSISAARPDLVHLDSLDLYRYLPVVSPCPVVCTHHNIESDLLRSRAARLGPLVARYVRWQANRLEEVERSVAASVAMNVMVSGADESRLRTMIPAARTTVVPNGVDTDYFRPAESPPVEGRCLFVGPTYSFPNLDAVEFLAGEIWPAVRASLPHASLEIAGRNSPGHAGRFAGVPAMSLLGHLDDIRPSLRSAACVVVPIRIGGGTRLKVLDAWAMGKAVVSTTIGCEGLAAVDGENLLIRDDPGSFADAVRAVLTDPVLRQRLGARGRETAVSQYDWSKIGETIRSCHRGLIGRQAG